MKVAVENQTTILEGRVDKKKNKKKMKKQKSNEETNLNGTVHSKSSSNEQIKKNSKVKVVKKENGENSNSYVDIVNVDSSEAASVDGLPVWDDSGEIGDSRQIGRKIFESIIHPVSVERFFQDIFEKKTLLIRRSNMLEQHHRHSVSDEWISTKDIDRILRECNVVYGTNIDVTSYENGQRETHNQEGRAYAGAIWDFYDTGCSIRMLNPQTYSRKVWRKLSLLQEFVGNFCGANTYLTPPSTQGFAPHWDDIEAFVIQLEGCKRWRVYKPTTVLPDYSSHNLNESDLPEPLLDCELRAGDVLYFPRGFIHQGNCLSDQHSLHITVSMFQKHSHYHLMSHMLPLLLDKVKYKSTSVRESLPCDHLDSFGYSSSASKKQRTKQANGDDDGFSGSGCSRRQTTIDKIRDIMQQMMAEVPSVIDQSVDQFSLKFMRESLPPCLNEEELKRTINTTGPYWDEETNGVEGRDDNGSIDNTTKLRLVRKHCLRLLHDEDSKVHRMYFSVENTRIYHEVELKSLELDSDDAKNVKFLIKKYPEFCCSDELPFGDEDSKCELFLGLYDKGILIAENFSDD